MKFNRLLLEANTAIFIYSGFKHKCVKNRYADEKNIDRLPLCVLLELLVVQDIKHMVEYKDIFNLYKRWKLTQ